MNYYRTSDGKRISKSIIDRKINNAKKVKLAIFLEEHGYYYCEDCKRSDIHPIDCSHDISVDECQKSGRAELAFDINNIKLRCRICHAKHDNL